jgi:hypothetical protein
VSRLPEGWDGVQEDFTTQTGCATEGPHKLTNTRKRTFPKSTAPIKTLSFHELDVLQALTDTRGIPQGEHLSAAERKQLLNFNLGTQVVSEGDQVAVTGFIAEDRMIRCGRQRCPNLETYALRACNKTPFF